ncbi:Ig-like domain-containing protein [Candidatus Bipolaricaulota bacterium]
MTLRGLGITGLLVVGLSLLALCNTAPTMEDQYVSTIQESAVTFELRAEDVDIDPVDPSAHPLRFSILQGPEHGVLVGDLEDVSYRAPHIAAVEVTYIPADGYAGTDFITLEVTDPQGELAMGTTTVEIVVEARRTMGILSGNWATEVTYNTQTGGFTAFRTQFTEVYRVGNLTLKSIASIQMETTAGVKKMVFDSLRFQGDYSIFGIDHTSMLAFDPSMAVADMYDYWLTSTRFTLGGVDFSHTLYLLDTQTDSYQALAAQVSIGSLSISNNLRFDLEPSCGFFFSSNDASISWSTCDVTLLVSIGFTCDGFEGLTLGARGIPIPGFGWLPGDVALDSSITFNMDGKSLSTSIDWRPGAFSCFRLLAELDLSGPGAGPVSGDSIINGLSIYGLRVECEIPGEFGDITFVSATSLGSSYNSIVTGQTDYFEVLRLSGPLLSCCGYPGSWSVATYFNTGSGMLFDWGMSLIQADIVISDHFNFTFETVFRSGFFGDPKLELTVGWMTRW